MILWKEMETEQTLRTQVSPTQGAAQAFATCEQQTLPPSELWWVAEECSCGMGNTKGLLHLRLG